MGDRHYFDFNATAPISPDVQRWLSSGNCPQGNPSSTHTTGQKALREIDKTKEFLHTTFGLAQRHHRIFFHSGASEGIATLLPGFGKGRRINLFHAATDHSCVLNVACEMEEMGHTITIIPVDKNGDFDEQELVNRIKSASLPVLLNCTWVNNETGVITPLEKIIRIKKKTNCIVHVDAVQSAGKISHWNRLSPELDAYTFSGHKFGALKGCGFSFLNEAFPPNPLIPPSPGRPLRGGTENLPGIISQRIALEELGRDYSFEKQARAKNLLEQKLALLVKDRGEIVAREGLRNGNTICLLLHDTPAQISTLALSMAGIDAGSGSACSSGAATGSHVLKAMGYSKNHAKNAIRLSFPPGFRESEAEGYHQKISAVLARFL